MSDVKVKTNNVPRFVLDACELTPDEREEFDYLDWERIEEGSESATFFRYQGTLYELGQFTHDYGLLKGARLPEHLSKWDGYMSEGAFSALVVRIVSDDQVVIGRVLS